MKIFEQLYPKICFVQANVWLEEPKGNFKVGSINRFQLPPSISPRVNRIWFAWLAKGVFIIHWNEKYISLDARGRMISYAAKVYKIVSTHFLFSFNPPPQNPEVGQAG